jgi:hypothetical protein
MQNEPNLPPGQAGEAWREPIMRNEPNFAGRARAPEGEVRKTNPILRLRIADFGFKTDLRRDAPCGPPGHGPVVQTNPIGRSESCETNPISPGGTGPAGAWDAKRMCKTNPICHPPRWDQRDRSRETKPISPPEGVGREPVLSLPKERPTREEPRADRAKRTQFPAFRRSRRPTVPGFHHSNPRLIMRNKAKLGRAGASGGWRAGKADCAKRSQFRKKFQVSSVKCEV